MAYAWCSHCLNFCRVVLQGSFISCSTCGKVFGQVSVKTASSNMERNSRTRFKRAKRGTNRQKQTCSA